MLQFIFPQMWHVEIGPCSDNKMWVMLLIIISSYQAISLTGCAQKFLWFCDGLQWPKWFVKRLKIASCLSIVQKRRSLLQYWAEVKKTKLAETLHLKASLSLVFYEIAGIWLNLRLWLGEMLSEETSCSLFYSFPWICSFFLTERAFILYSIRWTQSS